jgi:hypothetical protein
MPVSKPYEMTFLVLDLVLFARYMLVPGGRLVFFLPTVTEDWDEVDVPVVEGMRELRWGGGSCQDFGKWGRRVSRGSLGSETASVGGRDVDLYVFPVYTVDYDGEGGRRGGVSATYV